ncbi:hypothetical protein AURDEDRAFT_163969 [Auricularia subglabra TFB-10046 SS5]|nr:hypothetical protein AURDEDRAFT_163969 [Auricularia subglabra TFB-10046 SS5]
MAHKLPDEILTAILSPLMEVPDATFASDRWISSCSRTGIAASTLLLVCKRWMRVVTPLLYETVVTRSPAQAIALSEVLRATHDLGGFITKLRVEHGFGDCVPNILVAAPNITDLAINLRLADAEDVAIFAALGSINPCRLIVLELPPWCYGVAPISSIAGQTLAQYLPFWSRLVSQWHSVVRVMLELNGAPKA